MTRMGRNLRALVTIVGGIVLTSVLAGCGAPEPVLPILGTEDYTTWARTHTRRLDYPVPGHGSGLRRIYINAVGRQVQPEVLESGERRYDYPAGTVIVKEVFATPEIDPSAQPAQIVGMLKAPAAPEAMGGWIWFTREPRTGIEAIVTANHCLLCHDNANEEQPYGDRNPAEEFRDFVYFPYRGE